MLGMMQDKSLMISDFLTYAERWHGDREIVSRGPTGVCHRYTYADAGRRARRLASALVQSGVRPGDRIATLAMNGHRHFELFYGVSGIGAILHTVNPKLFAEQIAYIMNHADDKWLFLDPAFLALWERLQPDVPGIERVVVLSDHHEAGAGVLAYEALLAQGDEGFEWPEFDERTASSLCYTSGTTGNPKGVLYSHRSTVLHAMAAAQGSAMGLSCHDVVMPLAPMFHANAWSLPYLAPMTGAKLVLPGPALDGASVHGLIVQEAVSFTVAVPTVVTMLFEHLGRTGARIDTLSRAVIGGSSVPTAMIDRLRDDYGCSVLQVWGMTETSPLGTLCTPTHRVNQLEPAARSRQLATAGRAQFGIQLKLVDNDGRPARHDGVTPGALFVRGPWVASGYFNDDKCARLDVDGWFPTGDVATIDEFGYLRITDRIKDVIKSGGEWISSVDVENVVYSHPDVGLAAVVSMPHPKWEERPCLFVVPKAGSTLSEGELLAYLRPRMAKWWLPDRVIVVAELPLTGTGKIRKAELRRLLNPDQGQSHLRPGPAMQS